jgi:protein-S-isoprenylcysteine O-methyltransferase Ste14
MTCDETIQGAERASRGRAIIMALAGLVLVLNTAVQYGDPDFAGPGVRGASWILIVGLWMFILAHGGGLRMTGRMRQLLNDELSLRNRARAMTAGFYAALAAGLAVYAATWWVEIASGDAVKLTVSAALSTALLVYAWLEWD